MIVQHPTIPSEIHGNVHHEAVRIKITPAVFNILIAQQYKNRVGSVIREVVCNAWDAHVAAGNPNPVEVIFPTLLAESTFVVRDEGTGIPPDQIMEIYMTLFSGTRSESNEYLGGFGLGAKSPWAYNEQFLVENRYHGSKTTYSMYLDGNRQPCVATIDRSPTYEPDGLTVTVPVNQSDINEFRIAGMLLLPWFGDKVKTNLALVQRKPLFDSPSGALYAKDSQMNIDFSALVGSVPYFIPTPTILRALGDSRSYITTSNKSIVLKFNIGEVTVTPNREDLSIDTFTFEAITNKLRQFIEEIKDNINDTLKTCTTYNDACKRVCTLLPFLEILNENTKITFQGRTLHSTIEEELPPGIMVKPLTHGSRRRSYNKIIVNPIQNKLHYFYVNEPTSLIIASPKLKYIPERLKEATEEIFDNYWKGQNYLVLCEDANQVINFFQELSIHPVTTFDLNAINFIPPCRKRSTTRKKRKYELTDWQNQIQNVRELEAPFNYLLCENEKTIQITTKQNYLELGETFAIKLRVCGWKTPFYWVPKNLEADINKYFPDATNLLPAIRDFISQKSEEIANSTNIVHDVSKIYYNDFIKCSLSQRDANIFRQVLYTEFGFNRPEHSLAVAARIIENSYNNYNAAISLMRVWLGIPNIKPKSDEQTIKFITEVYRHYELFLAELHLIDTRKIQRLLNLYDATTKIGDKP